MNTSLTHVTKPLLAIGLIAAIVAIAACGDSKLSTQKPTPTLAFATPPAGATAEVGTTLAITLNVTNPNSLYGDIYVIGQGELGTVQMPSEAPYTATLAVPADLNLGNYTLTAVGQTSASATPISASTVIGIVPNPAIPVDLQLPQGGLVFEALGERLPITVPGATQGLEYLSAAPSIATVSKAGIVTALKTGETTITVSLKGSFVGSVPTKVLKPALVPSVMEIDFGNQGKGSTSAAQSVTLTNNTAYPVTILAVNSGTVFPFSSDCKSSSPLAPAASCTLSVSFAPNATGNVKGTLVIVGSAVIAPTRILLGGTGS